jgi:hypothetical protein
MDYTLAKIVLPMLKQLKETKHGVPADLIQTKDGNEVPFEVAEKKWNKTLDEIIWSFEQVLDEDNDEPFHKNGTFDAEGYLKHRKKVQRGLNLFGIHYLNLWD